MGTVQHEDDELTIRLKNVSPAAEHEGIMRGIIQNIRQQQQGDDVSGEVKQGNVFLLNLLESILPDENQLRKAFK